MKAEKSLIELKQIQGFVFLLMGYSITVDGQAKHQKGAIPEGNTDSKAYKKLEKFYKKSIEKPLEKFKEIEEDLRLEHALEIDGKLVRNKEGNFEYNKAGEQALVKAFRELKDRKVELDYDFEYEDWDDVLALVPEESRGRFSLEECKEAFSPFYIQKQSE
jgi:hypothetical protein